MFQQYRSRASRGDGRFLGGGNPSQDILMIRDRMLPQAAIRRIEGTAASTPGITHDIPLIIIGHPVIARGMRQPQRMSHFMLGNRQILVSPGRQPGDRP